MSNFLLLECNGKNTSSCTIGYNGLRLGLLTAVTFAPTIHRNPSGESPLNPVTTLGLSASSLSQALTQAANVFSPFGPEYTSCLINLDTNAVYINGYQVATPKVDPVPVERNSVPSPLKDYALFFSFLFQCADSPASSDLEVTPLAQYAILLDELFFSSKEYLRLHEGRLNQEIAILRSSLQDSGLLPQRK
jgi:hypothetical protein